ncbi:MAG TPA: NAD-dependent epimerase/dehydratase family protein [Ktedonobacteraceae bacterium]|nr:NAD-dependent epimerase/dehydratase family protein [Ktedonobacteraceae bacterium]
MRILVIGGTRFLGRRLVEVALERNHDVTLFNRGKTNADLFLSVPKLRGDRHSDVSALQGKTWDVVIDTCGYVPRVVSASAQAVARSTALYIFISSISVYADFSNPNINESSPVATMPDETLEDVTNETYGALKALCEQAAESAMPGRVLHIRPGYIVGPYDPTDRFTYWPFRIAQSGEVAAPGKSESPVQFIDVRDLTEWLIRMSEQAKAGTYNATGPDYMLTMQRFLETCKGATRSDARLTWLSESFIFERNLEADFPIWTPTGERGGSMVDCAKAIADGLTFRPLEDTIQATIAWNEARPEGFTERAGISREREVALLEEWRSTLQK